MDRTAAVGAKPSSKAAPKTNGWAPVYRVVRRIPAGRVSTYGEVAELAGMPRAARQVGWALNALDESDASLGAAGDKKGVPWHRVINAQGHISRRGEREIEDLQRALLTSEGIDFDRHGKIDLERYRWKPRRRSRSTDTGKTGKKK